MRCDDVQLLHAYHDGQLAPAARADVETHLQNCAECAALLEELRAVSRLVREAPLPEVGKVDASRLYEAWAASPQRGLLRIASWMTAAAAAVLVGSLVLWPHGRNQNVPNSSIASAASSWEVPALMPPPAAERPLDRPDELVEVAEWMADDLSADSAVR
jgi:anti-sigma factor RsiW